MPRMRMDKLGKTGLNLDIQPYLLPPDVWTRMDNCGTRNGELVSVIGETFLFNLNQRPLYHTTYITPVNQQLIIISDGISVYSYTMEGVGTHLNAAHPFTGGDVTFTNLNGILVVNATRDGAFYYDNTILQPLPGWDLTWRCTQIIAYKYYLVALGMVENNVVFAPKIRWSNSAAEGELPTEWVPSTSNDAGDDLIGETPGYITGGCLVREALFIVKEDSIYSMNYVGGQFVMQLSRLTGSTVGTKVRKGFAEVKGALALFTSNDLLVFDGNKSVSLVDQRIRTGLQTSASSEQWALAQVYVHPPSSTLYLSFVPSGTTTLRTSFVYDWEEGTWGHRLLHFSYGFDTAYVSIANQIPNWDASTTQTWDQQTDIIWNRNVYQSSTPNVIVFESNDTDTDWWVSAIATDSTNFDGSFKTCTAERISIPIEGADGLAMVTEVWPEVRGNASSINIYVGGQDKANSSVNWDGPHTVVPGQTASITPRITGRFIAFRVESFTNANWALGALTVNWEKAGER